jgi:hypothetical protein
MSFCISNPAIFHYMVTAAPKLDHFWYPRDVLTTVVELAPVLDRR